jgi:oxygen-independent coproporphyrinogen-3 oxidase
MSRREPFGVYVHLPFCPYICPYCDFAKRAWKRSDAAGYLEALRAELAAAPRRRATTVFFGGGTPNTYAAADIASLLSLIRDRFELPSGAEISMEINPDPKLCGEFGALREAGVNRLSIGAQSFDQAILRTLGRLHTPADVDAAVTAAREAGFDNISLDLIFGVPGQSLDAWSRTLAQAVALRPRHVSTYGLTVEEETPFWRWRESAPQAFMSSDDEADLYAMAIATLTTSGFEHYEISNFAQPGFRCAHNQQYWQNAEYAGFGVGAASYLAGVRRAATRDFTAYQRAALAGASIPAEEERLDPEARLGEAVMLALRTSDGVDLRDFDSRYAVNFLDHFGPVVARMREAGLLDVGARSVALTPRGRFVANDVCEAFITFAR